MAKLGSLLAGRGRKTAAGLTTLGALGAIPDFYFSRSEALEKGDSTTMANIKGGMNAAGWLLAEPLMWGITAAGAIKPLLNEAMTTSKENRSQYNEMRLQNDDDFDMQGRARGFASGERTAALSGNFVDNEQAATLRQRQMSLLRQHKMATETVLGSEARQLHR